MSHQVSECLWSVPIHNYDIYKTPHGPQGLGPSQKKGVERLQKLSVREEQNRTGSSGHDRTARLMNSQYLRLPVQDQAILVNNPVWREKGFKSIYPN